jgi:4-hydroxybenzoate polyprenyltransferase
MLPFFQILRPTNLFFIAFTHGLVAVFFCGLATWQLIAIFPYLLLCFTTVCVAASGYVVNDICDQAIDALNKPLFAFVGTKLSETAAWRMYRWLALLGLLGSVLLGREIFMIHALTLSALYLYAIRLKRTALLGNLLVAFLSAFSVLLPLLLKKSAFLFTYPVLFLLSFCFLLSLLREIIKDMQDQEGDKQGGCKTLPIVIGNHKTKQFLALLWGLLLPLTAYFFLIFSSAWLKGYLLAFDFVCISMIFYVLRIKTAKDCSRLSLACKLLLFSGILLIPLLAKEL